jgi:hypothetical protein
VRLLSGKFGLRGITVQMVYTLHTEGLSKRFYGLYVGLPFLYLPRQPGRKKLGAHYLEFVGQPSGMPSPGGMGGRTVGSL